MLSLALLDAVLRAGLLAVGHAGGVERAAHDLVAHAREVLDAPAAHEHDRVLLQVVTLAGDVRGDLNRARDAHARDLAQGGVRLLRRRRVHAGAHAAPLRRGDLALAPRPGLEPGRRELLLGRDAAAADELRGRWHAGADASSARARRAVRGGGASYAVAGAPAMRSGAGLSGEARMMSTDAAACIASPTGPPATGAPKH